jgi:hypothetical protein
MVIAADLEIASMECKGVRLGNGQVEVKTSITVLNNNDDNARHVRVVVVLPPTSHVISSEIIATQGVHSGAEVGPSYPQAPDEPWPTNGYVIFMHPETMDTNAPGNTVDMILKTKMLEDFVKKPITAFVFGSLPDTDPSNNCRTTPITF